MHFYQNKKSMVKNYLIGILLLSAAFLIFLAIWNIFQGEADRETIDSICKGSVALRAAVLRDIKLGRLKVGEVKSPLMCRTSDLYLPEDKSATEEDVKKEFADLMASCWERYGEGLVEDVFQEGDPMIKNCQVCYTISLRETKNFKDEVTSTEFTQYLFTTPYKVAPENDGCMVTGGFCIDSQDREDCKEKIDVDDSYLLINKQSNECKKYGKKSCCYTDYACWNKGGVCSKTNPNEEEYRLYDEWECPSEMKCFVENEDYYTYGEYIQRFGGPGNLLVITDIKPGETYAISFGSPTSECGLACTLTSAGIGGLVAGGIIAAALAIPTGFTSVGAYIAIVATGVTVGAATWHVVGENIEVPIADLYNKRDINTIYLTTLDQIQDQEEKLCRVVHDIDEER